MKKRCLAFLLVLCIAMMLMPTFAFASGVTANTEWYDGGTEFELENAADLLGLVSIVSGEDGMSADNFSGKTVKLAKNIDLRGIDWTPIGGLDAAYDFRGTFDGNGKTISNLTMELGDMGDAKVRAGLFASLSGTVCDLTIKNAYISVSGTNVRAGALGGNVWDDAAVSNVTVDGFEFEGSGELCVGGLAGRLYESGNLGAGGVSILTDVTVKNAEITVTSGSPYIGGISGYNSGYFSLENTTARNITIAANVTGNNGSKTDPDFVGIGGFFGSDSVNGAYDFDNCHAKRVKITLTGDTAAYVGGFGGKAMGGGCWANPNIDGCSAEGKITNSNTAEETMLGGYYGKADGGARQFNNVVADVDIVSELGIVGGFVGQTSHWYDCTQDYIDCEAKGDVSGAEGTTGGFTGESCGFDNYTNCEVSGSANGEEGSFGGNFETIAEIDGTLYKSLQAAVDAAEDGDTIKVLCDIAADPGDGERFTLVTVNGKAITLNLAGHTIEFIDSVKKCELEKSLYVFVMLENEAEVVITGNGIMDGEAGETSCYPIYVKNSELTVENGTFYGGPCTVIVAAGTAEIKGGTFGLNEYVAETYPDRTDFLGSIINTTTTTGTPTVKISGGTFINISPENLRKAQIGNIYIADEACVGNESGKDGKTLYTVETCGTRLRRVVTVRPTYTTEGEAEFYCRHCGALVKTESVPVLVRTADGVASPSNAASPIEIEHSKNGSVSASAEKAVKGKTITITVTPDAGYVLDTLTVIDENGKKLELTDAGEGVYTFEMPKTGVTVFAVFAEEEAAAISFADVAEEDYCYAAVCWAAENGITGGVDENHFAPNQPCTRAQIVTFLWRAAGSPVPARAGGFDDVTVDAYYSDAVYWAAENGITGGVDENHFAPNQSCTRAQAVAFLFRYAVAQGMDFVTLQELVCGFGDAGQVPGYAVSAFNWALAGGIVQGDGDSLMPNADCTRGQIVTFLYRLAGI